MNTKEGYLRNMGGGSKNASVDTTIMVFSFENEMKKKAYNI